MTCRFTGSHTRPRSITKRPIPRYKPLTMHARPRARFSGGQSLLAVASDGCETSMRDETAFRVRIVDTTQIRRLIAFASAADVTIQHFPGITTAKQNALLSLPRVYAPRRVAGEDFRSLDATPIYPACPSIKILTPRSYRLPEIEIAYPARTV
jgi:hypothetical protein